MAKITKKEAKNETVKPKVVGYLRVSTFNQEIEKNKSDIVSELSRLGRSMLECMEILSVSLEKGIHVYAVKGNW